MPAPRKSWPTWPHCGVAAARWRRRRWWPRAGQAIRPAGVPRAAMIAAGAVLGAIGGAVAGWLLNSFLPATIVVGAVVGGVVGVFANPNA